MRVRSRKSSRVRRSRLSLTQSLCFRELWENAFPGQSVFPRSPKRREGAGDIDGSALISCLRLFDKYLCGRFR